MNDLRIRPSVAVLGALLALTGCASTVKHAKLRDDYAQVDQKRVKRLLVVASPLPTEGGDKTAELVTRIARRDISLKRDFLIRETATMSSMENWKARCENGLEGVLQLAPVFEKSGDAVKASLKSTLLRCVDGEEVWSADASGTWDSNEAHVHEVKAQYVSELGEEVGPYVPAAFYLVRATIEAMPNPVLNDEDINEKIELGD